MNIPYSESELFDFGPQRTFQGENLSQIAFPLGGIGTGTVSLGGRGNLQDWEIFNRPAKGLNLPFTFFAIRIKEREGYRAKILESKLPPPYTSSHGLPNNRVSGLPRFDSARFRGEYPFAYIEFFDKDIPLKIKLEAFNPLIPLNDFDSGLPVVIFYFTIKNTGYTPIKGTLTFSMLNPVGYDGKVSLRNIYGVNNRYAPCFGSNLNEFLDEDVIKGIRMSSLKYKKEDPLFGNISMVTTWKDITYTLRWLRSGWFDDLQDFWDRFKTSERLKEEKTSEPSPEGQTDVATLGLNFELLPQEDVKLPIFLSWYFPYLPDEITKYFRIEPLKEEIRLKTYYSTKFDDSWDVIKYTVENIERLEKETRNFHDLLFSSSLPNYVLDAISSQISTIRTNTCFRTEDGYFFGFEGCSDNEGCCPMNCTHVWNYEQTLAYLFPQLEKSMRKVEFLYNVDETGKMSFRTMLPLGSSRWGFKPAADGQMGSIMRAYREWKFSGDDEFIKEIWPNIKKALEFAWINWDLDKDGVMEGEQHNTYDIEFYGPNTMTGLFYLGALKASSEIAESLGEKEKAKEYLEIFKNGSERIVRELFNGEYFIQRYDRSKEYKYQYGDGCLADQVLGQWLADMIGLGDLIPKDYIEKSLESIFKYNFKDNLSNHSNCQRTYALNDEKGLILCTWPKGNREIFPFPYSDEVWTGIEYQVASHLIYRGFIKEGLTIVRALRERFDGLRRNPWNEPECGHHYARAMASWGLLLALSGYEYDGRDFSISFNPKICISNFRSFFSTHSGWGMFSQEISKDFFKVSIENLYGEIKVKNIDLEIPKKFCGDLSVRLVKTNKEEKILKASLDKNRIILEEIVKIEKGEMVEILISP
ncbi:MAG: GH116 family glycosyl hydrolase [bacterium]|nr:GH116 family glycosyl hydrolase [bacterium]